MRIGLLTTSFPRSPDDIAGAFVLGFARALAARGHEIEVLAPEPREDCVAPSWPGVRTIHVPYLRPRALERTFYGAGVPDNVRRDPLAALGLLPFSIALTRACRTRAPHWDALVSHWALPSALAAGVARRSGQRHLAVLHSADVHLATKLPVQLTRSLARSADAFWFVSNAHRTRLLARLPEAERQALVARSVVAPMGVEPPTAPSDPKERAETRRSLGVSGLVALALGRLVPIKGLPEAIAACARANVTLLVVGDGPEGPRLRALAAQSGADIRFLGTRVGPDKSRLLRAADALVQTSLELPSGRTEGLPTVVLEALAHGLPVVASKTGGVPELLRHGQDALLFAPGDVDALSAALLSLRHDPGLGRRLSENGVALAERHLWPTLAPQIERCLQG